MNYPAIKLLWNPAKDIMKIKQKGSCHIEQLLFLLEKKSDERGIDILTKHFEIDIIKKIERTLFLILK